MKDFKVDLDGPRYADMLERVRKVRRPEDWPGASWNHGSNKDWVCALLDYWVDSYSWERTQEKLNSYEQHRCEIDGMQIHFFHIRPQRPAAPLLLVHGWPDSFLRYVKLFDILGSYELVVPSLPGFGFSTLPKCGFSNNARAAEAFHKLMTQILEYDSYIASGGDMGRGVVHFMASNHPEEVIALHLTDVGLARDLIGASDVTLNSDELDYKRRAETWLEKEGAYMHIQSTKPQTLAWALSDSPAALGSWIGEKFHAWSDPECLTLDDILDNVSLHWLTNSGATFIRMYYGNTYTLPPVGEVHTPIYFAAFPWDVLPVPEQWVKRRYPVVQYRKMPAGGHFTALECPHAFAESLPPAEAL